MYLLLINVVLYFECFSQIELRDILFIGPLSEFLIFYWQRRER